MLIIIVQAINPVREFENIISAHEFLIDLFLWDFKFRFGSALRIMILE